MLPLLPNHPSHRWPRGDLERPDIPEPDDRPPIVAALGQSRFEFVKHERLRDEVLNFFAERPHRPPLPHRSLAQPLDRVFVEVYADFCRHGA